MVDGMVGRGLGRPGLRERVAADPTPPLDPLVPTPASVFVDEAAVREVLRPWSTIKVVGAATAVALLAVVTSALLRTLFA